MAKPGPRYAEPENLTVDGTADHGCNRLPLGADCQRQRPEPVKQDTPGFAAPPTGPNQVGKLASAKQGHRQQDSASRRPPLKARVQQASTDGKSRNNAIAGVKLASACGVVDDLRLVDRLTDPNTGEAIPTALIVDDKGPFGFEHGTAPAPAASHPHRNSDHGPKTAPRKQPFQRLRHKRFCRRQGR